MPSFTQFAYLNWLNAQSLLGLLVFLILAWLLSENKSRFPWGLLVGAIGLQVALVLVLFAFPGSHAILSAITGGVSALAAATSEGTRFVFGYLGGGDQPFEVKIPAQCLYLPCRFCP